MDLHIEVHPIAMGNHGCSDTPNAEHYRGGACEQTEQYKWAASSSATIESAIDT
jgi:hypothetical protein